MAPSKVELQIDDVCCLCQMSAVSVDFSVAERTTDESVC